MRNNLNGILSILNIVTGSLVVLSGIYLYLVDKSTLTPLYIAFAIILVGPVEDFLNKSIARVPINVEEKDKLLKTVDLTTSLGFLLLLGLTLTELSTI